MARCVFLLAATTSAYLIGPDHCIVANLAYRRPPFARIRRLALSGVRMQERDGEQLGPLQDAWQRYVLIRPGMDMDELRNSTKFRTAESWTWKQRTPGTARTIILSAVLVTLFAIPLMLRNPAVLTYVLEFASMSRVGLTPREFFSIEEGRIFNPAFWSDELPAVLVASVGQLGRLIADVVEALFRERPAL